MLKAMAEKEAPASADTKKKSTLLEIDEDFLTSWKSIKVVEGGDFDCGTPPSKKKGFKFDKLDMDFSLDGNFSKLPSFKLDMGDLDFSSPARKKENVMETSDKEADVKSKARKNLFTLDFNFNGVPTDFIQTVSRPGGFDLDMDFSKEKKPEKSNECDKGNSSIQDMSKASRKELASNNNRSNDRNLETVNILESGATSKCIYDAGTSNPRKSDGGHVSHTDSMENPSINAATETTGKKTGSPQCSPNKTLRGRSEQRDCRGLVEENLVPELYAESVSGGDQVPMNTSEVQPHDGKLHADVAMGSENSRKMATLRTFSDTSATSAKDCYSRDEKCHLDSDSENEVVERGDLSMTKLSEENVVIQSSEITNTVGKMNRVDKDMLKHDSLLQSTLPSLRRSIVSLKENASALGLSKSADKSQDMQAQHPNMKNLSTLYGKLAGIANHPGTKSIAKVSEGAEDKRIHASLNSELKNSLQAQSGSEISPHKTPNVFSCRYEVTPQKTPHKDVSTNTTKNANHKSLSAVTAVVQDLGISAKMTPTLKQNTSPLSGTHKMCNNTSPEIPAGQSTAPHNKALIAKHSDVRIQLNLTSKMKHIVGSDKVATVSPSLKRKTLEETNTESVILKPLKQLRGSSCDREVQVAPEMLEKRKVSGTHEVLEGEQRNYFDNCTSELVIFEANKSNVEVPLLIENDSNIEKAEACSKELDELCNMLKKKNDEAKEILVRAVVNNNLLLMLNHPIYEEKYIQKLQRLLSDLALAERSF